MKVLVGLCLLAVFVGAVYAQGPSPDEMCHTLTSCSSCINGINGTNCFWCGDADNETMRCSHFDFDTALPVSGISCPQLMYNVGNCDINALTIIILIVVACFLFVVSICCFICCCCFYCAKRRKKVKMIEDARYAEEKDSIRQRSAERRAERKAKHDEIRRKYGLNREEDPTGGTYRRLE